ncbi:MAG: discoidin domain-containing protein, partial [Cytophagales bacterium]|nr:discoidin domain-containing protein [Cytophaga sp.]
TNTPPTVSITAPANNATFTAPSTITITADAADADGIARVEFYNGASKLGEDATSPYSYVWSGVAAGTYSITVKAVDNLNASTTSSIVSITVTGGTAVNLALNKTATASSVENGGTPASGAVDGNATSTRWASAFADPQWIYVDLGASYNVNRVKITWEGAMGKDYVIQVSNDLQNWGTAVKTVTNNSALVNDWTGLSGTGRYVRMYGTARATGYGYSIYELEVYGTSGARVALLDNELEAGINVTVFPNPASEQVAVSIQSDQDQIAEISLYNQSGQEVIAYSYTLIKGENKAIIPVSEYSEGNYILVISSGDKKVTQRLMIVK